MAGYVLDEGRLEAPWKHAGITLEEQRLSLGMDLEEQRVAGDEDDTPGTPPPAAGDAEADFDMPSSSGGPSSGMGLEAGVVGHPWLCGRFKRRQWCYQSRHGRGRRLPSVLASRLTLMILLASVIILVALFAWYYTQSTALNSVNDLAASLRTALMARTEDRIHNLMDQCAQEALSLSYLYRLALRPNPLGNLTQSWLYQEIFPLSYNAYNFSIPVAGIGFYSTTGLLSVVANLSGTTFYTFNNEAEPTIVYQQPVDPISGELIDGPTQLLNVTTQRVVTQLAALRNASMGVVRFSPAVTIIGPTLNAYSVVRASGRDQLVGVAVVTTKFQDVSHFMETLDFKGGLMYLLDSVGSLLAVSDNSPVSSPDNNSRGGLLYAGNSSSPLIRWSSNYLIDQGGLQHLISTEVHDSGVHLAGTDFYVDAQPINLWGLQMLAVVVVPQKPIVGSIHERSYITLGVIGGVDFAVLLVGCGLVLLLTNGVSTEMHLKADIARQQAQIIRHLKARQKAELSSHHKSHFLANISHELRTPIAGIVGLLDMLLEDGTLTGDQVESVTQVHRCSTVLLSLVNELLDISKIEAGKLELDHADFNIIQELTNVVDIFGVKCSAKGVDIGIDIADDFPVYVIGDCPRVRQIFTNLLSNATKFTSMGHIVVRGWADRTSDEDAPGHSDTRRVVRVWFDVEDTGLGIPPNKWETVFENFVQADASTTRRFGGTGLGLSIVRKLVEMMGGTIRIVKKDGIGTCFRFCLILDEAAEAVNASHLSGLARFVDVVDIVLATRDRVSRQLTSGALRRRGYNVVELEEWGKVRPTIQSLANRSTSGVPHPAKRRSKSASQSPASASGGLLLRQTASDLPAGRWTASETAAPGRQILAVLDCTLLPLDGSDGPLAATLKQSLWELKGLRDAGTVSLAFMVPAGGPASLRTLLRLGGYDVRISKPLHVPRVLHLMDRVLSCEPSMRSRPWSDSQGSHGPSALSSDEWAELQKLEGGGLELDSRDQMVEEGESPGSIRDAVVLRLKPARGSRNARRSSRGEEHGDEAGGVGLTVPEERPGEEPRAPAGPCTLDSTWDELGTPPASGFATVAAPERARVEVAAEGVVGVKPRKGLEAVPSLKGINVLVAEDTPILNKLMVKMLHKLGATAVGVENGFQAVQAVAAAKGWPLDLVLRGANMDGVQCSSGAGGLPTVDVIIMDCQMPNMDGYEATQVIRGAEKRHGGHVPIIALTANAFAADRATCLKAGMDGYQSKPIKSSELANVILDFVKRPSD